MRVKGLVDIVRPNFELFRELCEKGILLSIKVATILNSVLKKIDQKSQCLVFDRLDFAHRYD